MSKVKSMNTKPEVLFRKALWSQGIRYRLHSTLPGKPDLVIPKKRILIFIDGFFWHQCPIHGSIPISNSVFWEQKLRRNVERDQNVNQCLEDLGWLVLRFWECEVKKQLSDIVDTVATITNK
jgi:DNA mismatch endonuclease (patch repair protein)